VAVLTNLADLVNQRAERFPDAVAFGAQQDLTWKTINSADVLRMAESLASELAGMGVRRGDRVVLWMPNHWRTPIYLFALWKLGAIAVPFDREMNVDAGARILASVEPRCVLTGYAERPAWLSAAAITPWWEPGSRAATALPETETGSGAEDLAAIVFTSGTTGNPKGCMISHANLLSQLDALRFTIPLDASCRLGSILPLSHLFELTVGLLYPFSMGSAIHYIPSRRGPDIVRVLSEQRITHMVAVPQLLTLMGTNLEQQVRGSIPAPLASTLISLAARVPFRFRRTLFRPVHRKLGGQLRMFASGGAALPASTQRLWERYGVRTVQGYGASECSPVIACGNGDGTTPIGSVGRPIRDVEVRLGPEGELLVRGPNVMQGYWRDPQRTEEVLHDGWYATGDLASIDANGNITLSGRARDLIVLPSGMNVWPQDVEDALREDAEIADAAVIATPTASGGATLHAYLIPARAGSPLPNIAPIVSRCNGRLAQHQRIVSASWWNEPDFPRTAIGKVRRNLLPLPEALAATRIDSASAADDPVGQVIAAVARVTAVQPDQTLLGLGLDSFGLVELALALEEKTGKSVSDGDLTTELTVAQVRALVETAPEVDAEQGMSQGDETLTTDQPMWPYRWGRVFRALALPFDGLYRLSVTNTVILGSTHLERLPPRVIFAGTHHSFADLPLIRFGLSHSPARRLALRVVVAMSSSEFAKAGVLARFGRLAFGLYPLRQRAEREASLRALARLAAEGNPILIFPQGIHARPELERADEPSVRFRPGVAHLAAALDAAVIPFGIAGTDLMIPPDRDAFHGPVIGGVPVAIRRGPLAIAFGEALCLATDETPQHFTTRLQVESFALTRAAERALDRKPAGW
jgi:long-chain acyl-CoA synthetase